MLGEICMATFINDYFRLPPEGTGKRIMAPVYITLAYNGLTGSFSTNDVVVGETSGASGDVLDVEAITGTTGHIYLKVDHEETTLLFTAGENLKVDGITQALADDSGIPSYVQTQIVAGANDPYHNKQFVDVSGSAYVRFSEGPQQLDAFGLTRQTSPTQVGDYSNEYGEDFNEFYNTITSISGGAESIDEMPLESAIRLTVGDRNGEKITRTSNKYHLYQTGFAQLFESTIQISDNKADVNRYWGYGDAYNGLFFKQQGAVFGVVTRSNVTGSVVETFVPQSSFNKDKVDGSDGLDNMSKINLDTTKFNLYWLDFQWLGAGQVRFGIYAAGTRITMHIEYHANFSTATYMTVANLPVRFEIENTAITSGTSQLKIGCSSVKTDGRISADFEKRTNKYSHIFTQVTTLGSSETYIGSLRSTRQVVTDNDGYVDNRKISIPEFLHFNVQTSPVIIRLYKNLSLTGTNYVRVSSSCVEADEVATSFFDDTENGSVMMTPYMFDAGSHNLESPRNFSYLGEHMRRRADLEPGETYSFTAQKIGSGGNADIILGITWVDMG